ncbi:MAG TPA: hypothetical protein VGX78_04345, partial [Pirellulales bacterium]|nr:hypothetical protein [Pirellulales bacterium]
PGTGSRSNCGPDQYSPIRAWSHVFLMSILIRWWPNSRSTGGESNHSGLTLLEETMRWPSTSSDASAAA